MYISSWKVSIMYSYLFVCLHYNTESVTIKEFSPYFSEYDNSQDFLQLGRAAALSKYLGWFADGIRSSDISKHLQHCYFVHLSFKITNVTLLTKNSRNIKPKPKPHELIYIFTCIYYPLPKNQGQTGATQTGEILQEVNSKHTLEHISHLRLLQSITDWSK